MCPHPESNLPISKGDGGSKPFPIKDTTKRLSTPPPTPSPFREEGQSFPGMAQISAVLVGYHSYPYPRYPASRRGRVPAPCLTAGHPPTGTPRVAPPTTRGLTVGLTVSLTLGLTARPTRNPHKGQSPVLYAIGGHPPPHGANHRASQHIPVQRRSFSHLPQLRTQGIAGLNLKTGGYRGG